jgi:hypothetical protein
LFKSPSEEFVASVHLVFSASLIQLLPVHEFQILLFALSLGLIAARNSVLQQRLRLAYV